MSRLRSQIVFPFVLAAALALGACERQVIDRSYRPSTGGPVNAALPYHRPNQPMNLVNDSSADKLPEGVQSMSDWARRHNLGGGPKLKPKTIE